MPSATRNRVLDRRSTTRLLLGAIVCALTLVATSTLAGAASSKASAAKISAHLTKTSFASSQAGSVKLLYSFSAPSKSFGYLLTFKRGAKWQTVKSVTKKGTFSGSKTMTVKQVFAGKPVSVGSYRLKLSADRGSKLLGFKVIKVAKPATPPPSGGVTTTPGSAPTNTSLPVISGTTTSGSYLSISRGSWSHSPTSYSYQWRRCNSSGAGCSDIPSTSSSHTLVLADVGSTMRAVVTATNSYGSASATSNQTAVVTGHAPVNTVAPVISGTTMAGQTLHTSSGSWTNSPTSYTYQWRRCDSSGGGCTNIAAAYSNSYPITVTDIGGTLRVAVTASNAYGSSSEVVSDASTVAEADARAVSAGGDFTCVLGSDHKIKCLGLNSDGQLGNGGTTNKSYPASVSGISNAVQISAGAHHSCALLSDHTIKCWGYNDDGELGDGVADHGSTNGDDEDISTTPVTVSGISDAVSISAGDYHTCALLSGGGVKCWGYNYSAQLGNDSTDDSSVPVQVKGVGGAGYLNARAISAGGSHSCAVLADGKVDCWGYNGDGELGDGITNHHSTNGDGDDISTTPVTVSGISSATTTSAGVYHTCALLSDNTIKCWGYNGDGELGDGITNHHSTNGDGEDISTTPVTVSGIASAATVSAGDYHTCALFSGSAVKCWGYNDDGELGDGTTISSSTPVVAGGTSNAILIGAGGSHACAVLSDHSVKCWGSNSYGQIGAETRFSAAPVAIDLVGAVAISSGSSHNCALLSGGTVNCWGDNYYGQLGDGTNTDSATPVEASGISSATQISAGRIHNCARLDDGTVECWGDNRYGGLGNGGTADSSTPVFVYSSGTTKLTGVTQVSAGLYHSCAVLSDHTVKCWGYNGDGELGDGITNHGPAINGHDVSRTPVTVSGISNAVAVGTGEYHSCALLSGGGVKCWGDNYYGQLGDGTNTDSATPVSSGVSNATAVSVHGLNACALLSSGAIDCWGDNVSRELGNGSTVGSSSIPVAVSGISNAVVVGMGTDHACAVLSGGTVACWGLSDQTGDNTWHDLSTPGVVSGISGAISVSAGGNYGGSPLSCALLSGGTVACWGSNRSGELGFDPSFSSTPVTVTNLTL